MNKTNNTVRLISNDKLNQLKTKYSMETVQ